MHDFLRSMRTAERLRAAPALREAISCETPLLSALKKAIREQRHVIISGSAGGGKTHLLDEVIGELESEIRFCRYTEGGEPSEGHFVRWHEDGTKLAPAEREGLLEGIGGGTLVLAINEGPLRALADDISSPTARELFGSARALLRGGQLGTPEEALPDDLSGHPVVLDVAGYDPAAHSSVIGQVLGNELVAALVEHLYPGKIAAAEWALLQQPIVIERVAKIIRLASLDGEPILWRELWNLVGDMALPREGAGSQPWYQRLVHGSSSISRRARRFLDVSQLVLPGQDFRLWQGGSALDELSPALIPTAAPWPAALRARRSPSRRREQHRMAQLRFVLCSKDEHPAFTHAVRVTPWIQGGAAGVEQTAGIAAVQDIIGRLNKFRLYSSHEQSLNDKTSLNLLLQTELSMRQKASTTQVLLGKVASSQLSIKRSRALSGLPSHPPVLGSRYYLQGRGAEGAAASLRLTGDLWQRLARQRAIHRSDRDSRELDLDLDRFFYQLVQPGNDLSIVHTDLETLRTKRVQYIVSPGELERHPWP